MTIIYISDFDLSGSGYMNIGVSLCQQLVQHGYDVLALGLGYKGQEHHFPFTIVPAININELIPMTNQLRVSGVEINAIVVALDIPLQERMLDQLQAPSDIPYIGIFPLESDPLCGPWAVNLLRMDARLIMSRFGERELSQAGVDSQFIPIALDMETWRPPTEEERSTLRQGLGVEEDTFVVLTVADNQERKNLSRSMEIFADFSRNRKAVYWLVTRPRSPVGWKLEDYAIQLGIMDRLAIWQRGLPLKNLWSLYAAADIFLLTSKAEGLAIPVLEAMACRVPVVGTRCAAIEEHLEKNRGFLIEPDYIMIDPWGNSRRYLAGRDDGICKMQNWDGMSLEDKGQMLNRAQAYVNERTWDRAGEILVGTIEKIQK